MATPNLPAPGEAVAPTERARPTASRTGFAAGTADGAVVACYLAAAVALLVLALVQFGTVVSPPMRDVVFAAGKAWIPNAQGIGPYSGKETFMLVGWLATWAVLHGAMKGRQFQVRATFGAALVITGLATLLMWPPVWHVLHP